MPELPDVTVYVEALRARILGRMLERVTIRSPFLLRSADPPISAGRGSAVLDVHRLGKRIAIGLDGGPLAGLAPDDRRPPALEHRRAQARQPKSARRVRLRLLDSCG